MIKKTYERKLPTASEERRHATKLSGESSVSSEPRTENEDIPEETSDISIEPQIPKKHGMNATEYGMFLVSGGAYTEKGFLEKLRSKERYSEDEIADALEYVKKFGYIDDKRLAENSLEKLAARLWGKQKICRYLAGKGIDGDVIESLDFSEIDFVSYCAELIRKNAGKPKEKLLRTLYNAGYSTAEIRMATDEVMS